MPKENSTWRRRLKRGAAFLCAASVLWLGSAYAVAYKLTRRSAIFAEPIPKIDNVEELRLTTTDGESLGGWFVDGKADYPVVLLLHGHHACRSFILPSIKLITEAGHAALAITQRAHGDSSGELNDFGWSARHDVIAAVKWLRERFPSRPIVIWGQSLGAASAVFAAEELGEQISGYILECPYQDLRTAVYNRTDLALPMVLNEIAYAGLVTVSPLLLDNIDQISPATAASKIPPGVPVLILAGAADRLARPEEARAIAKCLDGHCELIEFPKANHLQLSIIDTEKHRKSVVDFVRSCVVNRN